MMRNTQVVSKHERTDGQLSGVRFRPSMFRPQHFVLVISFFALIIGGVAFVETATPHSGLDPDISEITETLSKEPDRVDLLIRRGQLYRFNGNLTESLNDLERAWLLDPENRKVALERCRILVALGRDGEAEAALDHFLAQESDRTRVFALTERARIRARTGRAELAIDDFTSAIRMYPTVELYLARGQLLESLEKLEEAAAGYHEGLAKLGGHAMILKRGLIRVKTAQKQYGEGLKLINEELGRASVKSKWYLQKAEILAAMGQAEGTQLAHKQALAEANRVLGKRPTAIHLVARAKVYQAMGRMEEARRDLQLAVQRAPRFAEAGKLLKKLKGQ